MIDPCQVNVRVSKKDRSNINGNITLFKKSSLYKLFAFSNKITCWFCGITKRKLGLTEAKIILKKRWWHDLKACGYETLLAMRKPYETTFHIDQNGAIVKMSDTQLKLNIVLLKTKNKKRHHVSWQFATCIDFVKNCYYTLYSDVKLMDVISTLKVMRHCVRWQNLITTTFLFILKKKSLRKTLNK